jgi:hypothetical protein
MMTARDRAAWNRPVFVADGRTIAVGDIVLAAHCRGELQPAWARLLTLLQCDERAAALAEQDEGAPDEERLQSMSEEFRYEKELITAEETERWLEDRGLTLEDFNAHFLRHYWADTLDEAAEPEPLDYRSAPDALWDLLIAELLLSGELDRMAQRLSWRFAAAHGQLTQPAPCVDLRHPPDATPDDPAGEDWSARLGCDRRWIEDLQRLESAYRLECERLMTPDRVERSLTSMRLALTRLDLETVDVDSLDAVREVVMCVRDDGISLSDVASDGGYSYERTEVMLEDLPPDVQQKVLCAIPGEMLEPLPHDGGFHMYRLLGRADPDLADDEVRERVERRMLERHFAELTAASVRWLMAPSGTR